MSQDQFGRMLTFLRDLEKAKIAYRLRHSRHDAVMVAINVPGERWEVEFLEDGDVDVERFVSAGGVTDESALTELFARFSDPEEATQETGNRNDAVVRQ